MTTDTVVHSIVIRPLQSEDDFWRVRNLLSETVPLTPLDFGGFLRRWKEKHFYDDNPSAHSRLAGRVQLWETEWQVVLLSAR
ncbi:MAG: hypothetical protein R3E79_61520 [Caldilineaceae bacterium]